MAKPASSIASARKTWTTADALVQSWGFKAQAYHAGKTTEERHRAFRTCSATKTAM